MFVLAFIFVFGITVQMVPGVLIMTTYKLLLIPHRLVQRGTHAQGASTNSGADERYSPFGHLPKEYVQVRKQFRRLP